MNQQLKTELLRLLYAAIGAALVAFLQSLLTGIGGIHLPETSATLNIAGGFLATRLK